MKTILQKVWHTTHAIQKGLN